MATTTKRRLIGNALVISLDAVILEAWDNIKLDESMKDVDATSASSFVDQFVSTTQTAKGSVDTMLGSEQIPILGVGDEFLLLEIKEGDNDVSAILARFNAANGPYKNTKCRVTSVSESFGKDLAKATINFKMGFID